MLTLENLNIDKLSGIEKFNASFNELSQDERESLIVELSSSICKQYGLEISPENFDFSPDGRTNRAEAAYDSITDKIDINEELLTQGRLDYEDKYYMLNSIIHETTHRIQHKNGLFEDVDKPWIFPYYAFDDCEEDAYRSSSYVLEKLLPVLDPRCKETHELTVRTIDVSRNDSKNNIISRGYGDSNLSDDDIKEQMKQNLPFNNDRCKYLKLDRDPTVEKCNIENKNAKIKIIEDDDKWYCDISIMDGKNFTRLLCNIGEACKINFIFKFENEQVLPTNLSEKKDLMEVVNKIVNIYNERYTLNPCESIDIMPISLFDNKSDYDEFLNMKHKITKIDELNKASNRFIRMAEIRNGCKFGLLEHKLEKEAAIQSVEQNLDEQNIDEIDIG